MTIIASALIVLIFFKFSVVRSVFKTVMTALAPITYGFVIAYICNPLMMFFERRVFKFKKAAKDRSKLRRALSILVSFIIVIALIAAFFALLIPQIGDSFNTLSSNMGGYIDSAQRFVADTVKNVKGYIEDHEWLGNVVNIDSIAENATSFLNNIPTYLRDISGYLINSALGIITEVKNLLIGMILAVYMLYAKEKLCAQIKKILSAIMNRKHYLNVVSLGRFTDRAFGGFIKGKLLDSLIIGLLCFILFGVCGFKYYPLISLTIAITNIVPIFGPIVGGIILVILLLITQPSKVILFLILDVVIQYIDGNVVGPRVLGESIGLSGMWIMISITIFGGLFGLPGFLLGVPAFAVVYSLLRELSENRLKKKEAPHLTDSYLNDPPEKDYLHEDIFIRKDEEIPENMMYPPEAAPKPPEKPKKTMWKKVEEKAVSTAKSTVEKQKAKKKKK